MTSGYSTTPRGGAGAEDFRQRADRGRAAQGCSVLVLSGFGLVLGIWSLTASQVPLGTMFVLGGLSVALYGGGRIAMGRQISRSACYWQQGTGFLQFGPSRRIGLRDYLPAAVALTGALVAVWMQLVSGVDSADDVWTLVLAALMLLGAVLTIATVPGGGRGAPEIILTPDAVWFWTGGRGRACVPWAAWPSLEASIIHRMRPHVMITGGMGGPVLFPIVVVPIGLAQLQTVLRFYTTHAELRGELATGQGLQRVRAFMTAPDLVGEGVGGAVVPKQVRGGVAPAPDLTRPISASPPPVSPHGGVPYGNAPYGGAAYATPRHGAVGAQAGVPEPPAPFGSAVSRPPTPPDAIGYGYGDGPPPSETTRMREETDGPRRDDGFSSSEPVSCAEADRKALRAPWRFLIWAIIVLVGSAYLTTGRQTGVFLLGLVVFLVLLIHAVALAGARRCRTVAHRRWTWSSEGVRLTNTWFVPLAIHVEMTLLGVGSLLSVALLAISDRADRGGVVVPFVLAMVLLVTAAFVGLGTPLPRRRSEVVLGPERIRFAVGTRRESPFWWADRPRVAGVGSGGAVLMDIEPMGRIKARLDTQPLTYVQLQRVVAFYSRHPELRGELATAEGLMRVQGLTGPASVAPLE